MTAVNGLRDGARWMVKDLLVRLGLKEYRPLVWSAERWDDAYRRRTTDGYGALEELARYSLLVGYLRSLAPVGTVLDVGCGAGILRERAEDIDFRSWVGVDLVPAAIAQASALEDDRTRFAVGQVRELDVASVDVAICNEVIYMAADPVALLDDIVARVTPGGHLLTSIWRHPGDRLLWRQIDERFLPVDRVRVRNPGNRMAPRGWTVALHRRVGGPPKG